jgi:F0F1-type ATP synthase membrane subunit c/vacuolar-type H+-ATPase subunit K
MPSRARAWANITKLVRTLSWAGLVLAVAAYGAVVVRNVTDMLVGMASHQPSMVVVERPNR